MTKHVVIINGSPRRETTWRFLKQIGTLLNGRGITTETVHLGEHDLKYCTGCEQCIRKTTWCVFKDDSREILEKIIGADGLILASPVYVGTVTGRLKSLLDKTASWLHRPPAAGLPVLPFVTTAGSGQKQTLDYLAEAVTYWGAHPVPGIHRSASNREPVKGEELDTFIRHLGMPKKLYKPALRQVMLFQVQKVLALKVADIDRNYWREKGWDSRNYYYPCRIPPHKLILGKLLFFILFRRINPTDPF